MTKIALPTYNEAARALSLALMAYTRETGLTLKPEQFTLRVHPDEWASWVQTADSFTGGLGSFMAREQAMFGFTIEETEDVEPGHPVLRCHWEYTL